MQPVQPVKTDGLLIGMGERYDVMLEGRDDEVRRIIAVPPGKPGRGVALLRSANVRSGAPASMAPFRMPRRILSYADLLDAEPSAPPGPDPGELRLDLGMHGRYAWTIGGQGFGDADPIRVRQGQPQRFVMRNTTMMPHPMHLHGHLFRPKGGGPAKDTMLVGPRREVTIDWTADNRGAWAFHCHNVYHQEAGMMRRIDVE